MIFVINISYLILCLVVIIELEPDKAFLRHMGIKRTTIIVDRWAEDWYFLNLDSFCTNTNNLSNFPNPKQYLQRRRMGFTLVEKSLKP